jgi:type I restriction enzyme, S subunit
MTTALPTAPAAYGLKRPSATVTVDNATPQGSTYQRGYSVQTNGTTAYRKDAPSVFASYLIRLHADATQVDNYYLGQLLNSYNTQCRIKRFATPGVQQVNINAKNLGKVLIPVPVGKTGLDEQREIAALLEAADERIRSYVPIIASLEQLKKSLMHDLLTGTVRVDPALFKEPQ